jgi:NTP pyrophosphatase (non-canonical NTP hydrolase)
MFKFEEEAKKYMQNKVKNEELLIVEVMTAELYQYQATQTAIFPKEKALEYLALGLTSEAGEVAGKVKKLIRDGEDVEGFELKKIAIASEVGDVLWYCAMMAKEVGVPLNTIMKENLEKLHSRKERGTLSGSGDDR